MDGNELLKKLKIPDFKVLGAYRVELLGAAIMLVGVLFFYNSIYKGEQVEFASLKAQIVAKKAEIVTAEAKSKSIAGLKKSVKDSTNKLEREKARLNSLKERLPSTKQISQLLAELSGERRGDKIKIRSIKPMAVEEKGELIRLPFQINLEAGFFSFGNYVERLENLERVMVIENFKLESPDGDPTAGAAGGEFGKPGLVSQVYLSAYILGPIK